MLTIEIRRSEREALGSDTVAGVFSNVTKLHSAMSRLCGVKDPEALTVMHATSGTGFRFDFKGAGEPIKQIKELMVELWNLVRHRRADMQRKNNQALIDSLATLQKIDSHRKAKILSDEDIRSLKVRVVNGVLALYDAGAKPREIPENEVIRNQKLFDERRPKALPPAASEKDATSKGGKTSGRKPARRKGKPPRSS